MVTIRDKDRPYWSDRSHRYYVVGRTKKSAMQQAKRMAGYSVSESTTRAGIVSVEVLERLS